MKQTRKVIAGIVTLILILAMVMPVMADDRPETPIEQQIRELQEQLQLLQLQRQLAEAGRPLSDPNPRLLSPQNITITAGETREITLTVRNIGTHTAFNYLLQAVPNGPFSIEFLNNSNSVNSVTEGRQVNITMRITADANADTGNHTIALTHNFRTQDRDNETRTDTPIQVRVVGADDTVASNLEIRNLTAPTGNVNVGGTAAISFYVYNAGDNTVRNISVAAAPATDIVPITGSTLTIASLAPGESHRLTFSFRPLGSASTRSYDIGFTVTCPDREFGQFAFINVFNPEEDGARPDLEIRNMTAPTHNIYVGQVATISFYVHNAGEGIARNFSVRATPEVAAAFRLEQTTNPQTISNLAPEESHRLTFSFVPLRAATTDSYTISFAVTYGDTEFEQTTSISVINPNEDNEVSLTIRNMSAPTGRINVGGTAAISFYVHNPGQSVARNIRVAAAPENAAILLQTVTPQSIPNLGPGESYRLTFNFSPRPEASTGSYVVGFTVTCADGTEFSQDALINVYNPDEDTATGVQIPRVVISNTVFPPTVPRAGQEFELIVTFRNTSATRSVNNVRILMEEVQGTAIQGQAPPIAGFSPVGGSNTLFIDYIEPRGEVTMTLRFTTMVDATPGSHNMRFAFDYQDQDFAELSANEQISINVAQFSRLELRDVEISPWDTPMVGRPVRFSYVIINSGRVNLLNVRTATEGPFDGLGDAGMFIGRINAQAINTFTGTFIPTEPGQQRGYFIITAEDVTGELVEHRHEFDVFVEGGWDDGGIGMDMGGDMGMGGGRPGMAFPGGDMGMPGMPPGDMHWDYETGNTYIGSWCMETFEFVPTHVMCRETGEWLEVGGGGFLGLIRRPIVWVPAIGVVVIAAIVVIVIIRKKKTKFDFMDDDE